MTVETTLSESGDAGMTIAGYALSDLMCHASFAECAFLLLGGERPTEAQARMTNAILVSCIDHGINAPSTHVARSSASCGVPLATAVAAGMASIGSNHGGAGEACARLLQEGLAFGSGEPDALAALILEAHGSAKLPGFGHRVYKMEDPRSRCLLETAGELGLPGRHVALALALERGLESRKGKRLVLNVDGAQAAILSDMGLSWKRVQAFFLVGRSLGLCAQVLEELETGAPLSYVKAAQVDSGYRGPRGLAWRQG